MTSTTYLNRSEINSEIVTVLVISMIFSKIVGQNPGYIHFWLFNAEIGSDIGINSFSLIDIFIRLTEVVTNRETPNIKAYDGDRPNCKDNESDVPDTYYINPINGVVVL